MAAVLKVREPSGPNLDALQPAVGQFELLATAPGGVVRLREMILTLAVQGKLLSPTLGDEPAAMLLNQVRMTKRQRDGVVSDFPIDGAELPCALPEGWVWARFGDYVLELCTGPFGSLIHKGDYVTGGVPLINPSHMIGGRIVHDLRVSVSPTFAEKLNAYRLSAGDVLLARRGEVGRYALVTNREAGWLCGTGSFFVRLLDECDRGYVGLMLEDPRLRRHLLGESVGSTMTNLNQRILLSAVVAIPPLAEQARIVARVDELMRLCDALEAKRRLEAEQHARLLSTLLGMLTDSRSPEELAANWQRVSAHFDLLLDRPEAVDALNRTILELAVRGQLVPHVTKDQPAAGLLARIRLRRVAQRKLTDLDRETIATAAYSMPEGWAWASVDQLSADAENAIGDGPFGANLKTEHYVETPGFRVIRLQNIGAGTFRDEHRAYVDEQRFLALIKHEVKAGDIVVAGLVDESIRCCLVPKTLGPAIVKADCYRFSVHEEIVAEYVCMYLSSDLAHEFASPHHHGLTLSRIGLGNFRSIPVPVPPVEEQRRIVARVNQLRRLCADLRQRLSASRDTQARLADALIESAAA